MNLLFGLAAPVVFAVLATAQNLHNSRARSQTQQPSSDRFNYFDVELLQESNRAGRGNVVISPASVKALMAMVLEGAGGQTAEQLRQALRIEESTNSHREQLNAFLRSLQVHSNGYTVEMGNRMFVSNKVTPKKEYKEALEKYYFADVRQVDFSSPQIAATTINEWVNEKTRGFISRLVEPDSLSPYSKLMMVNAVYFKGKWKVPFDPEVTSIKNFYPEADVCNKAFYMEILGTYPYAYIKELDALALELPYEGNKFTMLLLMPRDTRGIDQLMRDLPYSPLQNIISKLVPTEILVSIPRFKMEFNTDLVSSLRNLGIEDVFEPRANLSGMLTNGELSYITNVFHKAKIEVNEEGSIAGAGTGAIAVPLMGKSFPKFHPNKPFVFFIRDLETGSILFEGRVSVPELANKTCYDSKPGNQQPLRPSQGATNNQSNQQVPNIQPFNMWPQQRPNINIHQQPSNPHSTLRPLPGRPEINTKPQNYPITQGNEKYSHHQNYKPQINRTTNTNPKPLSGERDSIQFFNSS